MMLDHCNQNILSFLTIPWPNAHILLSKYHPTEFAQDGCELMTDTVYFKMATQHTDVDVYVQALPQMRTEACRGRCESGNKRTERILLILIHTGANSLT